VNDILGYLAAAAGALILARFLRLVRLFIKPDTPTGTNVNPPVEPDVGTASTIGPIVPPPEAPPPRPVDQPVIQVPAPQLPPEPIDAYYRKHNRDRDEADREVSQALYRAQHAAIVDDKPQLLTIYDPADVKPPAPLFRLEHLPYDDIRRKPDSGYPFAGSTDAVVVLDFRPLPHELDDGTRHPFSARWAARAAARREALRAGAILTARQDADGLDLESSSRKVQGDIDAHKAYSARMRAKAATDIAELLPEIRAEAERLAREHMVAPREDELRAEAAAEGLTYEQVVDRFVREVGDGAVRQAKTGPLDADRLFRRLRNGGAWQY